MCERCTGEPYRGVRALFNGDFQASIDFDDRRDWLIVSKNVIVFMGDVAIANAEHPLVRGCERAVSHLEADEVSSINELSEVVKRSAFGSS